jgi:hypothetical protein
VPVLARGKFAHINPASPEIGLYNSIWSSNRTERSECWPYSSRVSLAICNCWCAIKAWSSEALAWATASSAATRAALSRSASSAAFSASISSGRSSAAAAMPESNHKSRLLTRTKCSDLPGAPRSEGVARVPPINAVEHVGELRRRDGDRPVGR